MMLSIWRYYYATTPPICRWDSPDPCSSPSIMHTVVAAGISLAICHQHIFWEFLGVPTIRGHCTRGILHVLDILNKHSWHEEWDFIILILAFCWPGDRNMMWISILMTSFSIWTWSVTTDAVMPQGKRSVMWGGNQKRMLNKIQAQSIEKNYHEHKRGFICHHCTSYTRAHVNIDEVNFLMENWDGMHIYFAIYMYMYMYIFSMFVG